MDRRTKDSKLVGNALADVLSQGLIPEVESTDLEYVRAERCRICNRDRSDRPNSIEVRQIIDRELANNSSYRAALEAVEPLVSEWPSDQRPTYAAIRNHAKLHLKREIVVMRRLMEAHALEDGIDVENGDGSILNPGGVLASIMEKGFEAVRDGRATPTVGETIAASRAMTAIDSERMNAKLDEAHMKIRALSDALQEFAPEFRSSTPILTSEFTARSGKDLVVLPEADVSESPALEESGSGGFTCDQCEKPAKSRGGLLQHKRRKHANVPAS